MSDESCIMLCSAIINQAIIDLSSNDKHIRNSAISFFEGDFCYLMIGRRVYVDGNSIRFN